MIIREYRPSDCEVLAELFRGTVLTVNARDYTKEQLDAWVAGQADREAWNRSFLGHLSLVAADDDGTAIGFGDIGGNGFLDRLYVHAHRQREGIGTALCDRLEAVAAAAGTAVTTHASVTARPFFEKRGYRVVTGQRVERHGILLTNFVMEKRFARPGTADAPSDVHG